MYINNKQNKFKSENVKICLIYLMIGFFWIVFSDKIANKLASDNGMLLMINTYKGCLYVIVTSTILYLLIKNFLKKVDLTEKKLNESYEELTAVNEELEAYVQQLTASEQELKSQYDQITVSEYNFRNIFEASSDGIFIISDGKVIDCNMATAELLGYDSKAGIIGKSPVEFSLEKQPDGELSKEKALKMYKNAIENGKYKFEWWHKRTDGRVLPIEVMMTPILLNGKKVFHALCRDISERKEMEDKMEYLSYHDQLTDLYNRRFFVEELSRLDKEQNLPVTIIMGDINGLKLVNDSFGHAIGDELIKKVVEIIIKGCGINDDVCRIGGDEFVILLPKTDNYEGEKVVEQIKALSLKEKLNSIEISISFGYETKKSPEENIEDILKKAEDNMYKKKLIESPSMRLKTINSIMATLNKKNKREEQHNNGVSRLCQSIGIAMGLSNDEIKQLEISGLMHDIGKIAIDQDIINKPGKLTDVEWEEVKRHSEIGYRILSTLNDMSETAKYVLAHHEKWDGTGYPKGLKGKEIPIQSRIIAIADSFEAMRSERYYCKALSEEDAIEELKKNAGIQFDPELVYIFIEKVLDRH